MSAILQTQTTILPGNRIDVSSPKWPEGEAVMVTVETLESPADFGPPRTPDQKLAEARYCQDVDELIKSMPHKWVVYTPQGRVLEGDEPDALHRHCQEMGLDSSQFIVHQVPAEEEIVEADWLWKVFED
jgi:hypothetical protein